MRLIFQLEAKPNRVCWCLLKNSFLSFPKSNQKWWESVSCKEQTLDHCIACILIQGWTSVDLEVISDVDMEEVESESRVFSTTVGVWWSWKIISNIFLFSWPVFVHVWVFFQHCSGNIIWWREPKSVALSSDTSVCSQIRDHTNYASSSTSLPCPGSSVLMWSDQLERWWTTWSGISLQYLLPWVWEFLPPGKDNWIILDCIFFWPRILSFPCH